MFAVSKLLSWKFFCYNSTNGNNIIINNNKNEMPHTKGTILHGLWEHITFLLTGSVTHIVQGKAQGVLAAKQHSEISVCPHSQYGLC